ncbi:Coq4 family protein [Thermaurantiacus sp.]
MSGEEVRALFEAEVESGRINLHAGFERAAAALMAHTAFVDPRAVPAVFDALARALDVPPDARAEALAADLGFLATGSPAERTLPRPLWDAFWAIAAVMPQGPVDPLAFTASVVALGTHYDSDMLARSEAALFDWPCVVELLREPEVRMKTADLAGRAADSLGTALLTMLEAQGYDLEVIDADTVVLPGPYPAQNRTNRRILQLHDIWHLVAGYGFTGAGEVAISGFQLAQFGQNYSARFLATVATLLAFHAPPLAEPMLHVMLDGWRHGRATPPLIHTPWHRLLDQPIPAIRAELGIRPFESATTAMFEDLERAQKAA